MLAACTELYVICSGTLDTVTYVTYRDCEL